MANSTEPDGSQPAFASTSESRKWLNCTPKTARRRIDKKELDGWQTEGGHYFFHLPPRYLKGPLANAEETPNAPGVGSADSSVVGDVSLRTELAAAKQTIAELQNRVTSEQAKRREAEDAQRRLLAVNNLTISAAKKLQAGSDELWKAVAAQRDLLAENLTPDDLSLLDPMPERPQPRPW